jgi:nucleoside 2-deoxyribosyltransferase
MKKVYLAGDCLNKGSQLLRTMEKEEIEKIDGVSLFNPMDAEHNDKKNTVQEGLAERIFANDTKAILESDTIVFDISQTIGTSVEVGQVAGINHMLHELRKIVFNANNKEQVADGVFNLLMQIPYKEVYWKSEDVRDHEIPEYGYRRSHSYNAYLLGALLKISGEALTFEEILEELKK